MLEAEKVKCPHCEFPYALKRCEHQIDCVGCQNRILDGKLVPYMRRNWIEGREETDAEFRARIKQHDDALQQWCKVCR